jgi:hypothetical protein
MVPPRNEIDTSANFSAIDELQIFNVQSISLVSLTEGHHRATSKYHDPGNMERATSLELATYGLGTCSYSHFRAFSQVD